MVGQIHGTGVLVSRDGLVLTALHVIADLDDSVRNERLMRHPGDIVLRFGDPANTTTWSPAGTVTIERDLYSFTDDWVVLRFTGAVPDGVGPLTLADLAGVVDGKDWTTFGFPEAALHAGNAYPGTITAWGERVARLHSPLAASVAMSGISGAPCVVGGEVVALIRRAIDGGVLLALHAREIARAAGGRLPFPAQVAVPFEREVRKYLPADDPDALRDGARKLELGDDAGIDRIARQMLLAGVLAAEAALAKMAVDAEKRAEVYPWIAAAQLHHEAVTRLAAAARQQRPGKLRASSDELCDWYTRRARHQLDQPPWGSTLLHVLVDGEEDGPPPAPAPPAASAAEEQERADDATAQRLLALIKRTAEGAWADPKLKQFRKQALAGNPAAPFCIALHGEVRVAVVVRLRKALGNAHFLMVSEDDIPLSSEERAEVEVIAPRAEDEDGLVLAYQGALARTG